MSNRWKKSVIHLECATDSLYFKERDDHISSLQDKLSTGEITQEEYFSELDKGTRDLRFQGSALFLEHKKRRYLVTARHVLLDKTATEKRNLDFPMIFNMIFRVPSLDEVSNSNEGRIEFLMNLGAGLPSHAPYTFSSPELDLAIISLDSRNTDFANQLIQLGYTPMPSDFIDDLPNEEGEDVYTIGFPQATSLLGQLKQHSAAKMWSSSNYSLPVFSYGKVSMTHESLPFYWCDMSIYPGNSGGPVFSGERLVGVVSAQASTPLDGVPQIRTRIPFAKVIKSCHVKELLSLQIPKDCL
ncbi:trypsin-like peptidase domain-containing protein [Vibrio alginolyticus]|nr:trypsin-like peptidase domain-containing protein [Vibrio alginolyticus]